nr:DUF4345 family protein [Propioniciclava sp.]
MQAASTSPTVDSHVRYMGAMFAGYGIAWLDAADHDDVSRFRLLAALMAAGGASRLITRGTLGRPDRVHDVLMAIELVTPLIAEASIRLNRKAVTR